MSYGILFLRVVLGVTVAAHGAQKLFGWFGGSGPRGTAASFGTLGFRAPLVMAFVAGCSELGGGLLVASGLALPAGALAVAAVVLTAAVVVQAQNGFWNQNGGVELTLLIWTAAVALAAIGPGRFSLDASIGWADSLSGVWWGVGVAAVSILATAANVRLGRSTDFGRTPQPVVDEAPRRAA